MSAIDQPGYSPPPTTQPLTTNPADWPRIAAYWLLWQGVRAIGLPIVGATTLWRRVRCHHHMIAGPLTLPLTLHCAHGCGRREVLTW